MTEEQITLAIIRDTIAQAPEDLRSEIVGVANRIRAIINEHPETGPLGLALVGAEFAAANS